MAALAVLASRQITNGSQNSDFLNFPVIRWFITRKQMLIPKSLYRNCAGRQFYGTENVIWAGFGLVGNTEKYVRLIMSNFWLRFFYVIMGKIYIYIFFLNIVASALKSCIKSFIFLFWFLNFVLAQNRLNIHNQLYIALLETHPCATSI